jgi:hypothetical protein
MAHIHSHSNHRTARDIALQGLTAQQRANLLELAALYGIPNEDSIYWMGVMLRPDEQSQKQLDEGFNLIAGNMEHFTKRLIALEAVCQSQAKAAAVIPSRRFWLLGLLFLAMGTMLDVTGLVWSYQSRPVAPASAATGQVELVERSGAAPVADQRSMGLELSPQLMQANRARLKLCQADGNSKCTFLVRPES